MGTRVNGVDLSAGLSNPMTTLGDIITGGASGTPRRLAAGAEGEVLTVTGGEPGWAAAAGVALSSATPQPIGTATAGVSADAARADHVHALNTSLQSAPDTGWTAAGDGTASITAGVATITVTSAQTSGVLRRAQVVCSPHLPAVEIIGRVTVTSAPSGNHFVGVGATNADIPANASTVRGLIVQSQPDGNTYLFVNTGGSWSVAGSVASPATLASGQLWQRLIYSAGGVTAFVGAGASLPSSWTTVASTAPQHLLSGPGVATQIMAFAGRGVGTGDLVVDIADIQWRSLLGAPT